MVKPDKSRYVYLYLPSRDDKERWSRLAENAGTSLSNFVIDIVENALAGDKDLRPRGELTKEIEALRKEVNQLRDELKLKNIVLDRYEAELERYRNEAFLSTAYEGVRKHNRELIDLLKRGGTIDSYRILEALKIDPKDSELVKAIMYQLEELEAYGLITSTSRGWRWVG